MKKAEVAIGGVYVAKVSGVLSPVKILRESVFGGWDGQNERTGKPVRIRSAARLRREVSR
jgi:hypothetical protein